LPAFAILVALGVWQLERLQWKLGLIDEMTQI
jgi:cytochrome oxidase assembly protein ShyY1